MEEELWGILGIQADRCPRLHLVVWNTFPSLWSRNVAILSCIGSSLVTERKKNQDWRQKWFFRCFSGGISKKRKSEVKLLKSCDHPLDCGLVLQRKESVSMHVCVRVCVGGGGRRLKLETILLPLPHAALDPLGLRRCCTRLPQLVLLVTELVEIPLPARHPSPGMTTGASVWGFSPADAGAAARSYVSSALVQIRSAILAVICPCKVASCSCQRLLQVHHPPQTCCPRGNGSHGDEAAPVAFLAAR